MKRLLLALAAVLVVAVSCTSRPASTATPVPPSSTPVPPPTGTPAPPTATPVPPTSTPAPPTRTPQPTASATSTAYKLRVTKDLEYSRPLQPALLAQKLDVYAPDQPGPWPVVILLPGYGAGRNTMADVLYAKEIAGRGAVVFLADWHSGLVQALVQDNGVLWRESVEELTCAVRFARARAADYGGDPGWLTVVGGRAEGQGLVQALAGDESEAWDRFAAARGGPPPQAECVVSEGPAQVDAYVAWSEAPTEMEFLQDQDPELWALCSSAAHFGQNLDLRVHLLRGAQDQRVRLERITAFQEAMKAAGYDVTLTSLPEGEDAPPWSGPSFEAFVQAILEAARP